MLQQRAHHKYHSPLLWTNTCCSHQRAGETNIQAGSRRLYEEMGFKAELKNFSFYLQSTV
jgi:isopentenyl-diphosphate delta-isomerase